MPAKYVCYYDCSNWNSLVEVMEATGISAVYRVTVYDRDGSVVWTDTRSLSPHQTDRLNLDSHAGGKEGLVMVEPVSGGYEFPSVLIIADEGRNFRQANRFVPFIRIPTS